MSWRADPPRPASAARSRAPWGRAATGVATAAALGTLLALTGGACQSTVSPGAPPGGGGGGAGAGPHEEPCIQPPDGICDEDDCGCFGCQSFAMCKPGGCAADGFCQLAYDACTCSDCDWSGLCIDYGAPRCTNDGFCDFQRESCGCADCAAAETCLDNVAACQGAPDGVCGSGESCACSDCLGKAECFPCLADGSCTYAEPCICPECSSTGWCAGECYDDGFCVWWSESCACADCAALPLCTGGTGGTGGGTG